MPKAVYLHAEIFDHPDRLAALNDVAALHELVLIGARHYMVDGRLTVLRRALAPRRMVALLVDNDLPGIERTLVNDLLNDGVIPVIVAVGDQPASPSMDWLQDDTPPASGAVHRLGPRLVKGPTHQLRRRRRGPPRNDAGELYPAT